LIVTTRLFYIDDSGSEQTNTAVYAWVELLVPSWREALRGWLDWRHELYRSVGIPADFELHATKFLGGRGRPTGTSWDEVKSYRAPVMADALRTISALPGLCTGAVFRRTTSRGREYHASKADAYAALVRVLDARLTAAGEFGLIVMDGDGTDPSYRVAHRDLKLATRSVIEDPLFQGSHHSQWVQMADLVAYTAYMHLARIPTKQHTWDWYRDLVATAAVTGDTPQDLKKLE
jgi:hypothetical protein